MRQSLPDTVAELDLQPGNQCRHHAIRRHRNGLKHAHDHLLRFCSPDREHAHEDGWRSGCQGRGATRSAAKRTWGRSEEHTSELQSLMRISYAVFCLKKKKIQNRDKDINRKKTK